MTQYKVTVDFPEDLNATERVRSGVVVDRALGYEGELTDEQLEAIKADSYLTVEEVKDSAPKADSKKAKK